MELTEKQIYHLNVVIAECDESLGLTGYKKNRLSKGKKVKRSKYDKYLKKVKKDAEKIIRKNNFPDLGKIDNIHDFLEKENDAEYYETLIIR